MFTNYVSVYTRDIFVWADNRALDLVISEHGGTGWRWKPMSAS